MSKPTRHEIVSNVDTIIVLKNPCIEFAQWGKPVPSTTKEIEDAEYEFRYRRPTARKKSKRGKHRLAEIAIDNEMSVMKDTIPPDNGGPSSAGSILYANSKVVEESIFNAGPSKTTPKIDIPNIIKIREDRHDDGSSNCIEINAPGVDLVAEVTDELIEEEGIRFRVCAGNLISASPWFGRVLKRNGWMESNRNPEDRWFYISAEDWDEEAFIILMNIFHLRNRKVPRTVTLEMLAKIAVLVDYYECGESTELFTDIWIADLKARTPIPTIYCRDLILWIWVSWVFDIQDLFKQSTAVAIEQGAEPIRNLGLPIPAWITGEIDFRRNQAIKYIMDRLHTQLDVYRSVAYSCPAGIKYSVHCGCMLLGALTKGMDSANILSPRPKIPFPGQSFNAICKRVRVMESPTWISIDYVRHDCNLSTAVHSIGNTAVASVEGLGMREKSTQNRG